MKLILSAHKDTVSDMPVIVDKNNMNGLLDNTAGVLLAGAVRSSFNYIYLGKEEDSYYINGQKIDKFKAGFGLEKYLKGFKNKKDLFVIIADVAICNHAIGKPVGVENWHKADKVINELKRCVDNSKVYFKKRHYPDCDESVVLRELGIAGAVVILNTNAIGKPVVKGELPWHGKCKSSINDFKVFCNIVRELSNITRRQHHNRPHEATRL